MARAFVWIFLGTVAFAAFTVVLGFVHLIRDLWVGLRFVVPGGVIPSPPGLPHPFQWNGPWLIVTVWYFAIVVPVTVLILLVAQYAIRRRPNPWRRPDPLDVDAQKVAVVLTAYNDEASIGLAVDEFRRLPRVNFVIVVDNNCTDRTAEVARTHGAIVVPESRQGYGYACQRGLRYALDSTDAGVIVLAEGDMTFFAEDLEKMIPYVRHCDLVLGTRTNRPLTRPGSQMDWFMSWGNLFLAFLIRLRYWDWTFLGRVQLTDVGCTFRTIRRSSLTRIIDRLTVGGMYFSPHMILVALRDFDDIVEVPIQFRSRVGASKGAGYGRGRAIRIGLEMVWEIALH